jgi:hypothetical protein
MEKRMSTQTETPNRFRINWHADGARYTVSIPNYDGGEVVSADVVDQLLVTIDEIDRQLSGIQYYSECDTSQDEAADIRSKLRIAVAKARASLCERVSE